MKAPPPPPELIAARPALAFEENVSHPETGPCLGNPPAKYTRAVHERICDELKRGQLEEGACARAGITIRMFRDWMKKGTAGDPHLWEFAQDVEIAYNLAEATALETVTDRGLAEDKDLRSAEDAKWYLERTRPKRYSKQVKSVVDNQIKEFMMCLEAGLPPKIFDMVVAVYMGHRPGDADVKQLEEADST